MGEQLGKKTHIMLKSFNPECKLDDRFYVCAWCVYIDDEYKGDLYKTRDNGYRHSLPSNMSYIYKDIKSFAEKQEVEEILLGRWV